MLRGFGLRSRGSTDIARKQPNFNATILGAAFTSLVVRNRAPFPKGPDGQSEPGHIVLFREVAANGVGSLLCELIVVRVCANPIREALDLENEVVAVLDLGGQLI